MTLETQTAFADRIKVAKSWVTQLKQQGRLVMGGPDNTLVDVQASLELIARTNGAPERAAVTSPDYSDARASKEQFEAKLKELDLLERQGALCEAHEVALHTASAATVIRSMLEGMPHQLTPQLAPITDPTRTFAILDEWRLDVQQAIARHFAGIADKANTAKKDE